MATYLALINFIVVFAWLLATAVHVTKSRPFLLSEKTLKERMSWDSWL